MNIMEVNYISMPKKVIYFTLSRFSRGGAEKNIYFLLKNLDRNKFELGIILFSWEDGDIEIPKDVKVWIINKSLLIGVWELRKILNLNTPCIVFSTVSHYNIYLSVFRHLFPSKIKFVAREANMLSFLNRDEGILKGFIFGNLIGKIFYANGFDFFIAQTESMRLDLEMNYFVPRSKIIVISNPALNIFEGDVPNKLKHINSKEIRLVTVGRLHRQKGINRIFEVIKNLPENFKLDIWGTGPEEKKLRILANELKISERVFFRGFSNNIPQILNNYNLFLLGSYYEGFPNIVLECSLVGLPVISFNCAGVLDGIIFDEINGIIIRDDSIQRFTNEVLKSSLKEWDAISMSKLINSKFSPKEVIEKYSDFFSKIDIV
jgi:glycosyltransferase involved in cell wall biosynthesis